MTELEYRKHPSLSQSDLKKIDISPVKFAKGLLHTKQTKEMLLGSYLHDLILLKDVSAYDNKVADITFQDKRKKDYKDFMKENPDVELFGDDLQLINNMAESLRVNGLLDKFELGIVELPIFFEFYDAEMKGKPDYYNDKVLRDLKTISDISLVNKSMESYLIQAGLYHYGLMQQDGINRKVEYIFVEKKEPFETAVIELPPVALEIGCLQAKEILDKWKDYQLGQFTNDKTYEPPNYLKYKYGV